MLSDYLNFLNEDQKLNYVSLSPFDRQFYRSIPGREEISYRAFYGDYYTILYNGKKAGIIGLIKDDEDKTKAFAQVVIHPSFRGKNVLKPAYDLLMKKHKRVRNLLATILDVNVASQKAHIRAGFTRLPEEEQERQRSLDWLDKDESRYIKRF